MMAVESLQYSIICNMLAKEILVQISFETIYIKTYVMIVTAFRIPTIVVESLLTITIAAFFWPHGITKICCEYIIDEF